MTALAYDPGLVKEARLAKILPVIAAHDQLLSARILLSANPQKVGKIVSFPAFYELFLVNESDEHVTDVHMTAHCVIGGGNKMTERFSARLRELGRGRALLLEQLDLDGLENDIRYDFDLKVADGVRAKATFKISKEEVFAGSVRRYCGALKAEVFVFSLC